MASQHNGAIYPATFSQLETFLFNTCEEFLEAARRVAALEGVSLTITHKSRNTPGKESSQYRGCLVLNCLQWGNGCTFEIKAYGPIDGGWRMRPLQHPGLKKHTVTSWVICNHPKLPLRHIPVPQISSWPELVSLRFEMPDDLIEAAHHVANVQGVSLYLLTLMISDGKPKPNGRNSTYIPRGFLTLECTEAGNGCPFAIKAREEEDGWYMRPWREKGKEIKGAVSTLICKHGPEVAAAFRAKQEGKDRKSKSKREDSQDGEIDTTSHLTRHDTGATTDVTGDIPSGLDPQLMSDRSYVGTTLSPQEIMHSIEQTLNNPHLIFSPEAYHSMNPGGSSAYTTSSLEQFRNALSFPPATTSSNSNSAGIPVSIPVSSSHHNTTTISSAQPTSVAPSAISKGKRRASNTLESSDARATKKKASRPSPTSLKASWKSFLLALDSSGRLSPLLDSLTTGGIDPGAVVAWPDSDMKEFVETVGADVPTGVKWHFKVLLGQEGKRAWDELQGTDGIAVHGPPAHHGD